MGGKTDIAKGRIEEAAGVLTGNDKLRHKGKNDQAVGQFKKRGMHLAQLSTLCCFDRL